MRYCVQPATAEDVALLAIAMNSDDEVESTDRGVDESGDQLLHAFVSSTHVWAARDRENQPCALWGVGPAAQDQEVGRFWLLTSEEIGAEARDMVALSIMILPEMLSHYRRLESVIDACNERTVELVKLIGFTMSRRIHELTGRLCHRVWVDSDETELPLDTPVAAAASLGCVSLCNSRRPSPDAPRRRLDCGRIRASLGAGAGGPNSGRARH